MAPAKAGTQLCMSDNEAPDLHSVETGLSKGGFVFIGPPPLRGGRVTTAPIFSVSGRATLAQAGSRDTSLSSRKAGTPASYSRTDLHRLYAQTCQQYGLRWSSSESEAFVRVVWKESRGNPGMRNSRSSSAGMYGFLRGTRRTYRVSLDDPQHKQARAFIAYCVRRYGSIRGALDFHRRHRYY